MPTLDEQKNAARALVLLEAEAEVEPKLAAPDDINNALDQALRATFWEAAKTYSYGDVIMPNIRNGHRYRCVVGGASGATEPVWPKGQFATITDGTSDPVLIWQDDGKDYDNVYDVRRALFFLWGKKKRMASEVYDLRQGGANDHKQSQIYEHCKEMEDFYRPLEIN